jgi:hypothetical protein
MDTAGIPAAVALRICGSMHAAIDGLNMRWAVRIIWAAPGWITVTRIGIAGINVPPVRAAGISNLPGGCQQVLGLLKLFPRFLLRLDQSALGLCFTLLPLNLPLSAFLTGQFQQILTVSLPPGTVSRFVKWQFPGFCNQPCAVPGCIICKMLHAVFICPLVYVRIYRRSENTA